LSSGLLFVGVTTVCVGGSELKEGAVVTGAPAGCNRGAAASPDAAPHLPQNVAPFSGDPHETQNFDMMIKTPWSFVAAQH
jgi:hypothetical protein